MTRYQFRVFALDASGKTLLDEQNGGELPLKMFDSWFDGIRSKAAASGATILLLDEYKRTRDKDTTTYIKQEFINGKWTKEKTITLEEYENYFKD